VFTDPQCERVWSLPGTSTNIDYLNRMGFEPDTDADGNAIFVKDLKPALV
jgi:hypothetical protein